MTEKACIDEKALKGSSRERYKYLDPIFYLDERTHAYGGTIEKIAKTVNMQVEHLETHRT